VGSHIETRTVLKDVLFLTFVVLTSASLYVTRLGFYSDDWAFLGVLSTSDDRSLVGLWLEQYAAYPNLRLRPTQIAYQAVLYKLFGVEPLGYHVVNALVFAGMTVVLYGLLRELRLPRILALTIPLIYALLPNYSTDRFWFAAFGYALSMGFCLGSVYADLRAIRSRHLLRWKLLSLCLLAAAGLGYEIVLPLLAVAPALTWFQSRRLLPNGLRPRLGRSREVLYLLSPLFALALIVLYKFTIVQDTALPSNLRLHFIWVAVGSMVTNFGSYGVGLPFAAWWGLTKASWGVIATSIILGVFICAYLTRILRHNSEPLPSRTGWLRLSASGITIFMLGYAVFLFTGRVDFSSTGISNRTTFGAALGAAVLLLAIGGWVSSFTATPTARRRSLSIVVAVLCSSSVLIVSALASYWSVAWVRQRTVLSAIRHELPHLPQEGTVILHGVCPYTGPAIIFESPWDLAGTLQAAYQDATLRADVTSSDVSVRERGISTSLYGGAIRAFYPYDDQLLLFDYTTGTAKRLVDQQRAIDYLETKYPNEPSACPSGVEGIGVEIFPIDRRYHRTLLYRSLEGR
jgi:hypothetical protein